MSDAKSLAKLRFCARQHAIHLHEDSSLHQTGVDVRMELIEIIHWILATTFQDSMSRFLLTKHLFVGAIGLTEMNGNDPSS